MDKDLFYIYKIKQGDITIFSQLIDKYKDMIFNIAFMITKNREDAEEVAQDAFVKVYKSINEFNGTSKFSTWLYSITYNTAISKIRKKQIDTISIDSQYISIEDSNKIDGLKDQEQKKFVEHALNSLSAEDRSIVVLYYLESKSINEIAEITNISVSNIKVKLYRSRKLMHSKLKILLNKEIKSIL